MHYLAIESKVPIIEHRLVACYKNNLGMDSILGQLWISRNCPKLFPSKKQSDAIEDMNTAHKCSVSS